MKVSTVNQMKELDRTAVEKFSIKEEILMENAGLATFSVIQNEFGIKGKKFLVLCGVGNNGGDALVVARKIHAGGGEFKIFIIGDPANFKGAAKRNFDIIAKFPITHEILTSAEILESELKECDAVIDGIFGTGLTRDVEGLFLEVIKKVNLSGKTVFSLDIPSGIDGDSGQVKGDAVLADYTVTFGLPKVGNILYPGFSHCGQLYVTNISFPRELTEKDSINTEINIPPWLPERKDGGHKNEFGSVLFIAGASSYFGAPYFSAASFLKAGGGYSRLASTPEVCRVAAQKGSEIVFIPLEETKAGSIALKNKDRLLELSEIVDMVVLGPGLSLEEETQQLVRELVISLKKPLLVDGDGLTALRLDLDRLASREEPTVLTPHPGEMSRLADMPVSHIKKNSISVAGESAADWNSVVVLKGAHSLIAYPGGKVLINLSGNSGMATAGSGDVLTGTIAAMFGLGLAWEDAVRTGVFIHGLAGDLAAEEKGPDGMTAGDILENLPFAVEMFRENYEEVLEDYYGKIYII